MATRADPLVAHCIELLSGAGAVRSRRMFGGWGLYVDDLFVALIAADELYLKVDAHTRTRFEAQGCRPFVYRQGDRVVGLGYWTAPQDAMESPAQMREWVALAVAAALRARAARRSPGVKRPRAR